MADGDSAEIKEPRAQTTIYMGIDGEGVRGHSPSQPNHHYVLLAAVSQDGKRQYTVENANGLSTLECLRFLISLPKHRVKLFGYSLNYDWTKILSDLDPQRLYLLFRPELRKSKASGWRRSKGPRPIEWQGYSLNLQGTKFTIEYRGEKVTIWDIWKFYQSKFVAGLKDWKVGTEALYERMSAMKNRRATFSYEEMPEIRRYCIEECQCMAELAFRLVSAHDQAGLELKTFYGAGSTATALLKKIGLRDKLRSPMPEMALAVSQAFFGGRFEHSIIGEYRAPAYNYDISSAYPYQCTQLPCLVHGTWRLTDNRRDLDSCRAALVHYALDPRVPCEDWAPFPYREPDGSICFPKQSPGGWVWGDEYKAGEAAFPDLVRFREAWIYDCPCACEPFKDVPHYYRERIRIGKEGPGIVYKLGLNSIYGKCAQSIGNAIFANWIYAGMITSGCRAQALRLFPLVKDRSDIMMIATDGLQIKRKITPPRPLDTGTFECRNDKGVLVPLGGWEETPMKRGVFLARPGIYYPTSPSEEDIKKVKGRGVGSSVVLNNHAAITRSWHEHGDRRPVEVHGIQRFCGAKTSISYSPAAGEFTRAEGGWSEGKRTKPAYGEWIERTVVMSFDPLPKRERLMRDTGEGYSRLALRSIPLNAGESMPYRKAVLSNEALMMKEALAEIEEQPDLDYLDEPGEALEGFSFAD